MSLSDDPLQAVFRNVLQNDSLELSDSLSFEDVPGWDSVAHVNLVTALEEQFDMKFTITEIMAMNSVGAIRNILAQNGRHVA